MKIQSTDFHHMGRPWRVEIHGKKTVKIWLGAEVGATAIWQRGLVVNVVATGKVAPELLRGISVEAGAALSKLEQGQGQQELLPAPEAAVRQEVMEAIGSQPDLLIMSNPIGTARFETERGRYRYVDYGLEVGSPDLVGMLGWRRPVGDFRASGLLFLACKPEDGRWWLRGAQWICLELKAPGKVPKPHQAACHRRWMAHHAWIWPAITSGREAFQALEEARALLVSGGLEPCPVDRDLLLSEERSGT